jgi:hypothetical protein
MTKHRCRDEFAPSLHHPAKCKQFSDVPSSYRIDESQEGELTYPTTPESSTGCAMRSQNEHNVMYSDADLTYLRQGPDKHLGSLANLNLTPYGRLCD